MKKYFELGVRLLAVYYFIPYLATLVSITQLSINSYLETDGFYYISMWISSFVQLLFILLLLIKPNIITKICKIKSDEDDSSKIVDSSQILQIGIILLGILFFTNELYGFIDDVTQYPNKIIAETMNLISYSIKKILVFAVSMVMIYKSASIANFLMSKKTLRD